MALLTSLHLLYTFSLNSAEEHSAKKDHSLNKLVFNQSEAYADFIFMVLFLILHENIEDFRLLML